MMNGIIIEVIKTVLYVGVGAVMFSYIILEPSKIADELKRRQEQDRLEALLRGKDGKSPPYGSPEELTKALLNDTGGCDTRQ